MYMRIVRVNGYKSQVPYIYTLLYTQKFVLNSTFIILQYQCTRYFSGERKKEKGYLSWSQRVKYNIRVRIKCNNNNCNIT